MKRIKKIKNNVSENLIEVEKTNSNKILYVLGLTTIVLGVGFALWYLGIFSSDSSNQDQGGSTGSSVASLIDSTINNPNTENNATQIKIIDNTTRPAPVNYAVAEINRINLRNIASLSSSSIFSFNRFSVLEDLEQNSSDSPTNSTDSSETIRPYKLRKGVLIGRLSK